MLFSKPFAGLALAAVVRAQIQTQTVTVTNCAASPSATSTSVPGLLPVSNDGTCGGPTGYTCQGSTFGVSTHLYTFYEKVANERYRIAVPQQASVEVPMHTAAQAVRLPLAPAQEFYPQLLFHYLHQCLVLYCPHHLQFLLDSQSAPMVHVELFLATPVKAQLLEIAVPLQATVEVPMHTVALAVKLPLAPVLESYLRLQFQYL